MARELGTPVSDRHSWRVFGRLLRSMKKDDKPRATASKRRGLSIDELLLVKERCTTITDHNMCAFAGFGILGLHRLGELVPDAPLQLLNEQFTLSKTRGELILLESKTDYFRNSVRELELLRKDLL
jgi:hypothetical protein